MARRAQFGRSFERSTRAPFGDFTEHHRPEKARKFSYRRLFQVRFEHSYYNNNDFRCPDFEVRPTVATRQLLTSLGLLFKDEGIGFSVLYNRLRSELLLDYLRRQFQRPPSPDGDAGEGVWTRLSFVLCLRNTYFVNFTDVPIDLSSSEANLYFTNRWAEETSPDVVALNPDGSPPGEELLRPVPTSLAVAIGPETEEILVRSISGETVMCVPRCFPESQLNRLAVGSVRCSDRQTMTSPDCFDDQLYLDFSELPEDKYRIEWVPEPMSLLPGFSEPVLYTQSYPIPLGFVNVLFTRPRPDVEGGVYPVRDLFASPGSLSTIETVYYTLSFRRRSTFWNYFIVPRPESKRYPDINITSLDSPETFGDYETVRLANGAFAYKFSSRSPIALEQRPEQRFQLLSGDDQLLMRRLPAPSVERVNPKPWPSPHDAIPIDREAISDIYVYV